MVLFHPVIEVLYRAEFSVFSQSFLFFKLINSGWIRGILIDIDHAGRLRMVCFQCLFEKALGGFSITLSTQPEVQRLTVGVHRSIQILPLTFDFHVGFIHSPGVMG